MTGPIGVDPVMPAAWFAGFAVTVPAAGTLWIFAGREIARICGETASHLQPRLAATVLIGFAVVLAGRTVAAAV